MNANRLIGLYLALVALVVVVQAFSFPIYGYDSAGDLVSVGIDVWHTLNWFMAAGLILMLFTTYREKRRSPADPAAGEVLSWIRSNVRFYVTVVVFLAFVPNWFAATWGSYENSLIWYVINTVTPVMYASEAHRIWRST